MSVASTLSRQTTPSSGQPGDDSFPWDLDAAPSVMENDTWLLSFIDVLTLLLALFVLLLAQEHQRNKIPGHEIPDAPARIDFEYRTAPPAAAQTTAPVPAPDQIHVLKPFATIQLPPLPQIVTPLNRLKIPAPERSRKSVEKKNGVSTPEPEAQIAAHEHAPVEQENNSAIDTEQEHPENVATVTSPIDRLMQSIHASGLADRIDIQTRSNSLRLDIADSILFAPARTALSEDGVKLLGELASTLKTLPWSLSVEGHTDNIPIKTSRFPSNWELSTARASSVARELIENGVEADRIRAIGYADTRPRASNDSPEGRNRNRRVTFVLELQEE
ncbi:chemotaxis protein MotB [Thiogranum longum]|uniref:Chemotaxis protein MotB n=1 Tax=Thiogranum longum TaxID=1537524 RepID=A0A4R1HC13_9GAMM|nr:OmpA family protein [Thiogranum longum]TCK18073.1 chemotaxis protein MotB [Thiogranum longum]